MNNLWNFKIDLVDVNVFDTIEKKYDIKLPESLKSFIIQNNAASPDADCVVISGEERVYEETLSFNENEEEASTFYSAMNSLNDKNYLPFAIDPFGNLFCYSLITDTIVFYDHEEDTYVDSNSSLEDFISSLYSK